MGDEVGIAEKLKIASTYLVNSPPGEFIDVFNGACRRLCARARTRCSLVPQLFILTKGSFFWF